MSAARERIFLIHDDPAETAAIADRLERLGYPVCGRARRDANAARAIAARRPDLVLMDADAKNATAAIETALRLSAQADLPLVLMAGADEAALAERILDAAPLSCVDRALPAREVRLAFHLARARHQAARRCGMAPQETAGDLKSSAERFAAFARIGADWLWETDAQDRFVFLSNGLKDDAVGPRQRLGQTRRAFASPEPENLARLAALEQAVARRKPFENFVYRTRIGDRTRWCMVSGEPIYGPDGAFLGYRGVGRDVENEIETRRALERKTRILDAALAATPDAISVANPEYRGVEWNDRLFDLFGLDKAAAEASGDPIHYGLVQLAARGEYGPGDPEEIVRERRQRVITTIEKYGALQYERQLKNGRWIEARLTAIEGGGWVSYYREITDRKNAELALRELNASLERRVEERTHALAESERFSRGIIDAIGAHLAVLSADGSIATTNEAWRRFAATSAYPWHKAQEGENYLDALEQARDAYPEEARIAIDAIRDVAAGRRDTFEFEYACPTADEQRWFLCRIIRLSGAGAPQIVVSHHNVTAVHQALERAAAGENTFASLAELSPVGIFRTYADGRNRDVNRRWCEITGMSVEDARGGGWVRALHPDDRDRVIDEWRSFVRGGSHFRSEYRVQHPGGKVRWVVGEGIRVAAGGGYIVTITDITEQKQIELALRALSSDLGSLDGAAYFEEAARRLATLLDAPMAYITRLDPARPGTLYTLAAIEDGKALPHFSYDLAGTPCHDVVKGGSIIVSDGVCGRYPDDAFLVEKGAVSYAGVPVLDPAGRVLGTIEILSRKPLREAAIAETTLKIFGVAMGAALTRERNRRQYEDLFEFAPRALVMMAPDGIVALANRKAERIFGWSRQEMIGQPMGMLVPGPFWQERLRRAGDADQPPAARSPMELLGLRKDGTTFPAEIDLAPVRMESGVLVAAAIEDIAPRKAIESALASSRDNLSDALESIDRGVILYDKEDRVVIFNRRFRDHFPGPEDSIKVGDRFEDIFRAAVDRGVIVVPDGIAKDAFIAERVARHQRADGQVMTRKLADGRILQVTEHAARNGGIIGIGADVTEQIKIEEQLRAVQKMEALGQLTGGMAHDFNNYLGVIVGNLDMLKEFGSDNPAAARHIAAALAGALRGAELTQSLLAFSRRRRLDPRITDLNERVDGVMKLLARTLGEGIEISISLAPELWPVEVDAAQFDSCIVNIAANARDAMPDGGMLSIVTRNEILDATYARLNAGVVPGAYALIELADTGTGMAPEILERVFEPFFTTKGPGHGTGLGLSMAYGFVKQSGGHIKIYSEPDHGTTVRVYLPRATIAGVVEYAASAHASPAPAGTETVLVVEDNEQLRATAEAQLASLGYRVLQAPDGHAALKIMERDAAAIDLLFSDVVMPGGMDGYALARAAAERYPRIRVLLTSGFPGDTLARLGAKAKAFPLLGKPYRRDELARAIREALDA